MAGKFVTERLEDARDEAAEIQRAREKCVTFYVDLFLKPYLPAYSLNDPNLCLKPDGDSGVTFALIAVCDGVSSRTKKMSCSQL
jgi:hypothetical protein